MLRRRPTGRSTRCGHCASVSDAAHVVMLGRRDRDRLRDRVDAGGDAACVDGRELLGETRADRLAAIEEGAAAGGDLGVDAPRATMSRGASSARMDREHEALAGCVDQRGAVAAQRLGGERRRVAADVDRGRVKLDEFRIGDDRAGARRHRTRGRCPPAGLVVTA